MPINGADAPLVAVFDSGVGGLSVLAEIRALLPGARLLFVADNEAFPYGVKPADALIARVDDVFARLAAQFSPDLLVVACNTASTVALPVLREKIDEPVVGVVPAIKPAAAHTKSGVIGLLATPATVQRPYTQSLIDEFAPHCRVLRVGSSELVEIAERKLQGTAPDPGRIRAIIAPLFDDPAMDTVVLACTHFPLLKDDLAAAAPRKATWIDSGAAIARRVKSLLHGRGAHPADLPPHRAVFTAAGADVERLKPALARFGLTDVGVLAAKAALV